MKYALKFRLLASEELLENVRFYESREQGLGNRLAIAIDTVLKTLQDVPNRFPKVYFEIREAPVKDFPFVIHYKIRNSYVIVLSVFHQSRDPVLWKDRK